MNTIAQSKIQKVNEMHGALEYELRTTVKKAIEIGKVLAEIRESCEHGEYKQLFDTRIKVSYRTACDYIMLHERCKSANFATLQEAISHAKQIETESKQNEFAEKQQLINKRKQTGKTPDGWTRAHEYEYKKQTDESAYEERKKTVLDGKKKETPKEETKYDDTVFMASVDKTIEYMKQLEHKKQAMSGNEDLLFMIDGYLEKLPSDSRRHEFCNTLIKHLRAKSIEYGKNA